MFQQYWHQYGIQKSDGSQVLLIGVVHLQLPSDLQHLRMNDDLVSSRDQSCDECEMAGPVNMSLQYL